MRRKIYFYSPNRAAHLPLVWGCLRAHAESFPEICEHYSFEDPFYLLDHQHAALDRMTEPSLLLVSCYLWNMNKNLELCRLAKERYPDLKVVAGGPHVPDESRRFFERNPVVDFAIHGEGEIPLALLLRELLEERPRYAHIPALTYREGDGSVYHTARSEALSKTIEFPSPYLLGYFDSVIDEARNSGEVPIALWETNRGCPYSCTFCDWGSATLSRVRRFADDRLAQEIAYFAEREIASVLCCDANFGILPRDLDLARKLVASKIETGYPQRFVTNYAKNPKNGVFDISKLFVTSGMTHGTILAMQSPNEEVLRVIKRKNIPFENYETLNAQFQRAGIQTYTEIILGLPRETVSSFVSGLCRILECGVHDDIMVYECAVLPNAELATEEYRREHGLETITRPYLVDDIEEVEVVIETSTLSLEDWIYCTLFGCAIQALHNRAPTRYVAMYLHRERLLSYEEFYRGFLDHSRKHRRSVLGAAIARVEKLLRDYLSDPTIPSEDKILSQPDMVEFLERLLPAKRDWLLNEWCWANIQAHRAGFYAELSQYLKSQGLELEELDSLLRFQRHSLVPLTADEMGPRVRVYSYDWRSYFSSASSRLERKRTIVEFRAPASLLRSG